jgi:uncharacterized protein (DUF2141 family)
MYKKTTRMVILLFLTFLAGAPRQPQSVLHVIIKDIQPGKGNINVAVFGSKNDFLKRPVLAQTQKARAGTLEFSFAIPPGEYAIAAYQDLNENQKLDAGIFHIPKEPYGFSNNYRPGMSPPKYEGCRIQVAGDGTCTIHLK